MRVEKGGKCNVELGIAPIEVRKDALGLRKVHELLRDKMNVLLENFCIRDVTGNVVIRNEKDMLVVEGNVSPEFDMVQKLLSEQFIIVFSVCWNSFEWRKVHSVLGHADAFM